MPQRYTVSTVYVVNKNKGKRYEPFVDSFDGIEYEFPQNVPVEIPEIVANHIFGYKEVDKETGEYIPFGECVRALARNSWNLEYKDGKQTGKLALLNFEISETDPRRAKAS